MKATLPSGTLLPKNTYFLLQKPILCGLYITFSLAGFLQPASAQKTDSLKRDSLKKKTLQDTVFQLDEVEVSTGYQTLPKERATGSFETVGEKLLNQNKSTDILSRLEGVTSGTNFLNNDGAIVLRPPNTKILYVRGSTGLDDTSLPLIVLDNFPYEGDINQINPSDVLSVTILKDAAAASVWGARAGGGVIVITTKKGQYNRPFRLEINASSSVAEKPDLFYFPSISTADFIGMERFLYEKGFYTSKLRSPTSYVSPVVALLDSVDKNMLSATDAEVRIRAFGQQDIRNDYAQYIYRPAVKQQYYLNLTGGSPTLNYLVSAGYDKNEEHKVSAGYQRLNIRSAASMKPIKNLEINLGVLYTYTRSDDISSAADITYGTGAQFPVPYTSLVKRDGLVTYSGTRFRTSYLDTVGGGKLLYWGQNPVDELNKSFLKGTANDLLVNIAANYQLVNGLTASVLYQYQVISSLDESLLTSESYFMRDLINEFTVINADGVKYNLPFGDQLRAYQQYQHSHDLRGQFTFQKQWGKHELNAMAAAEARSMDFLERRNAYLGYDPETLNYANIDLVNYYPVYPRGSMTIPITNPMDDDHDRFTSVLANVAYTYKDTYILSVSARKDASNLFGVRANQKGAPFWSTGLAWNMFQEHFGLFRAFDQLKLRLTYGVSGNTNNTVSAVPVISWQGTGYENQLPYASTGNPPNPGLKWERVYTYNAGADFSLFHQRLSGTIDYYRKMPKGLISNQPIDPSTGFSTLTMNSAELKVSGWDINLYTVNISRSDFKWNSVVLFSINRQEVVKFYNEFNLPADVLPGGVSRLVPGKSLNALFAYRSAGLDPQTGDPRGYLNGEPSTDYVQLKASSSLADFRYFGSSVPVYFGAFRNIFSYQAFSLSVNLSYKLGYYIRRKGLSYQYLYNNNDGHADFSKRWKNPGDEMHTTVPSMPYPINAQRDEFYRFSDDLVEKGDHIRLQQIGFMYDLHLKAYPNHPIGLFMDVNNVGIIWRANEAGLDPEFSSSRALPLPRQYTFGFKMQL